MPEPMPGTWQRVGEYWRGWASTPNGRRPHGSARTTPKGPSSALNKTTISWFAAFMSYVMRCCGMLNAHKAVIWAATTLARGPAVSYAFKVE